MAYNIAEDIREAGRAVADAIRSPAEAELKKAQMDRSLRLEEEELSYKRQDREKKAADEAAKKSAREQAGKRLTKTLGPMYGELYDSGADIGEVSSLYKAITERKASAKEEKPTFGLANAHFQAMNSMVAASNYEVLEALKSKDPKKITAAQQKAIMVSEAAEALKINMYSLEKISEVGSAEMITKIQNSLKGRDPAKVAFLLDSAHKKMQNSGMFTKDTLKLINDSNNAFDLGLDMSKFASDDTLINFVAAGVAKKEFSLEEAAMVMNSVDDPKELSDVANNKVRDAKGKVTDGNVPPQLRVLASSILQTMELSDTLDPGIRRSVKKMSPEELDGILKGQRKGVSPKAMEVVKGRLGEVQGKERVSKIGQKSVKELERMAFLGEGQEAKDARAALKGRGIVYDKNAEKEVRQRLAKGTKKSPDRLASVFGD